MKEILQKDSPILRQTAAPVAEDFFGTPELRKIITDMSEALASQKDGVAIAAPQIGESLRMFVVAGFVYDHRNKSPIGTHPNKVFINPEIVAISKDKKVMDEGCLSVRPWFGKTRRASRAAVRARDFSGEEFTEKASGFLAQIVQHEIDHLNGILFIDHAKELKEVPPKEEK